jgi:magnesium transporter
MARRSHRRRKRKKPRFHRRTAPGAVPGTLTPAPDAGQPTIYLIAYDKDRLVEKSAPSLDKLGRDVAEAHVTWINVVGFGDTATIQKIGRQFGLHPLALEDVINVHQRAKVEPYDDYLFIVTRSAKVDDVENGTSEQISLFLGKNFVLTFQQWPGDCFDPVRERIRSHRGRIRESGADYLAYALVDAVIDSYFAPVEQFAEQLDEMEEQVASAEGTALMEHLHIIRNDLLALRRNIRPHRDALMELIRDEHPLFTNETRIFLRDCYDHTMQLVELLEVYRETCSSLREFHLTLVSNRMNEVMKVLTIIATIFIPLSFVAGLYGMNFNTSLPGNMPELNQPYGYVAVLSLMAAATTAMLVFFWRRGWIGRQGSRGA